MRKLLIFFRTGWRFKKDKKKKEREENLKLNYFLIYESIIIITITYLIYVY